MADVVAARARYDAALERKVCEEPKGKSAKRSVITGRPRFGVRTELDRELMEAREALAEAIEVEQAARRRKPGTYIEHKARHAM